MFADDTKVFKTIKCPNDAVQLQDDINNLDDWSSTSGIAFNPSKCKAQTITRKINPITTSYSMNTSQLVSTKSERDLGVWISSDLTWTFQVNKQCERANKDLGYIRRNTRTIHSVPTRRTIYLTLVRPHLGYATQVWSPQSIELMLKLERPQRRATKYILGLPFVTSENYTSRLQTLNLLPICYWHEYLDMVHLFKVIHGLINSSFVLSPNVTRRTRSSTNAYKYRVPYRKTQTYQRSFSIRAIRTWNTLSDVMNLSMDNLSSSKSVIRDHYFTALANTYDCDDPRSFKTICPKCNKARTLANSVDCCF